MEDKTIPTKPKRLSKSKRIHARRVKAAARKPAAPAASRPAACRQGD